MRFFKRQKGANCKLKCGPRATTSHLDNIIRNPALKKEMKTVDDSVNLFLEIIKDNKLHTGLGAHNINIEFGT